MIKKFYMISFIILIQLSLIGTSSVNFKIIASVDEEIITNFDVLKEGRYLKVLSPNLQNFEESKLNVLGTESLIKQVIKEKEISKFIDLDQDNSIVDEYLENLISRLGYENLKDFNSSLLKNKTYTLEEVKYKIKIELFWNELIFDKYNDQISVNSEELRKKVNNIEKKEKKEFFLSEIVFKKKINEEIDFTIAQIKESIDEIGFNNTANIFSISESSKYGGKIGWINEDALSRKIYGNIVNLKNEEYSSIINVNDNFIILKVEDRRVIDNSIDRDKELQRLIQIERSKKLDKFSRIFFNKVKTQYLINEK